VALALAGVLVPAHQLEHAAHAVRRLEQGGRRVGVGRGRVRVAAEDPPHHREGRRCGSNTSKPAWFTIARARRWRMPTTVAVIPPSLKP